MAAVQPIMDAGPVRDSVRITSLDLIRGVAVLGILLMNAVHFKFGEVPYLNIFGGHRHGSAISCSAPLNGSGDSPRIAGGSRFVVREHSLMTRDAL